MAKILLHTCCGPCTLYPLQRLREEQWDVHGFFFNPNIHPYQEFSRRLEALQTVAEMESLHLILRQDYDLEAFLRQVVFREKARCLICYSTRLEETARVARKSGFDAFSTTLLYSRQQKHDLIRSLAEEASRKYDVPFHYDDFRAGWHEGQERAKSLGIYRQPYCGCIYSEKERFYKPPRATIVSEKPRSDTEEDSRWAEDSDARPRSGRIIPRRP